MSPRLPPLQIVTGRQPVPGSSTDVVTLFCPCCDGLESTTFESTALLPIHDSNGLLLAELASDYAAQGQFFAGVFALDPFRRQEDILEALKASGWSGIVNFPSITAIDQEMRTSLEDLEYGVKTEISLIRAATTKGFSTLAVVDSFAMAQEACEAGASGLVAARHVNESVCAELAELGRETVMGLFRLPDVVGGL